MIDRLAPVSASQTDYAATGAHLDMTVAPEKARAAATEMRDRGYFLESLTAVDKISHRQVVYHFNTYIEPHRVVVRADLDASDTIDSIHDIYAGADWQERECHEFLGVVFTGHPDLRPLLLPEEADWHPLRKDFTVPPEALAPEYR